MKRTAVFSTLTPYAVLLFCLAILIGGQFVLPAFAQEPTPESLDTEKSVVPISMAFVENVGQFDAEARFLATSPRGDSLWITEDAIWISYVAPPEDASTDDVFMPTARSAQGVNVKLTFEGASPRKIEPLNYLDVYVHYIDTFTSIQAPSFTGVRYVDIYPDFDLDLVSIGDTWVWYFTAHDDVADLDQAVDDLMTRFAFTVDGANDIVFSSRTGLFKLETDIGELVLPMVQVVDANQEVVNFNADPEIDISEDDPETEDVEEPTVMRVVEPLTDVREHFRLLPTRSTVTNPSPYDDVFFIYPEWSTASTSPLWFMNNDGSNPGRQFPPMEIPADPDAPIDDDAVVETLPAETIDATPVAERPSTGVDLDDGAADDEPAPPVLLPPTDDLAEPTPLPLPVPIVRNPDNLAPTFSTVEDIAFFSPDAPSLTAQAPEVTSNMIYSGFLGGARNDCFPGCAIAVNAGGSVYLAGFTASQDFPSQTGSFTTDPSGGDIFVAKINIDGTGLDYVTLVGGSDADYGAALAIDEAGHAYVVGHTASRDFPITDGSAYRGGFADAILLKLSPDGSTIDYAGYLGGAETDRAYGVAIGRDQAVYLTGETQSSDFPVTMNAIASAWRGGSDAFLMRLNPDDQSLAYSTLLGGNRDDVGQALTLDTLQNVYIVGKTASPDFVTTTGAFATQPAGLIDSFVVKITPRGELAYSTYLGGDRIDRGVSIVVDRYGVAYIAGSTNSTNFPTTPSAYSVAHQGGDDAFVAQLTKTGQQLAYATYLGGEAGDRANALALDDEGNVYLTGATFSKDFPVSDDAFDKTYNFGFADAFFAKFNNEGDLNYATYLGGTDPDYGTAVVVDGEGSVYLAGATKSASFPSTVNSFNATHQGGWDGFVSKIAFDGETRTSLLTGVVRDQAGNPIPDVVISAGSYGSTTTDSNGVYVLIGLDAGIYTLEPIKPGYKFSPGKRSVDIPNEEGLVVFVGQASTAETEPFLTLPLNYGADEKLFVQALQDTENRGLVTSWFDHDAPTYAKNQQIIAADGIVRNRANFNGTLGCYEHRCYDGHDGIDFVYRDGGPGQADAGSIPIVAAADGRVVSIETTCVVGDQWCGYGFGNYVVLQHDNGYYTLYAHLSATTVSHRGEVPAGATLGYMGTTGNSTGFHLHFGVYQDNGNGYWDGTKKDAAVDPFGWRGSQPDPWMAIYGGPSSPYLWQTPISVDKSVVGRQGGTLSDAIGSVEVIVPAEGLSGEATLELLPGAVPEMNNGNQSTGHAFQVRVAEWLPALSGATDAEVVVNPDAILARPMTVNTAFSADDVRHLDVEQLALHRWDEISSHWVPLKTTINPNAGVATAQTASVGHFDLQAPFRCTADTAEPDDHYYTARNIEVNMPGVSRVFDTIDDRDWFSFRAKEGIAYRLLASGQYGIDTVLALYDPSQNGVLAKDDNGGDGLSAELIWTAPHDGVFYVRVSPGESSVTGCDAGYQFSVDDGRPMYQIFLPLVAR